MSDRGFDLHCSGCGWKRLGLKTRHQVYVEHGKHKDACPKGKPAKILINGTGWVPQRKDFEK